MDSTYGQFCPIAMAADIVCSRWTVLVIRELLCGSTRFNDLRRGVPRMSPTLLSKRLKELEQAGVIRAIPTTQPGVSEYRLTPAGEDLREVVMGLGTWGQRWVETELTLKNLDPVLLMWDMRRRINPQPLPPKRCTINFVYPDLPESKQNYWLVVDKGEVDVCWVDPGFDIDLYISSALRTMTAIWMGHRDLKTEIDAGRIEVTGDPAVASSIQKWLSLSPFAAEKSRRAA
jgi:DNA-binding HxlR family transcriptional regulator